MALSQNLAEAIAPLLLMKWGITFSKEHIFTPNLL